MKNFKMFLLIGILSACAGSLYAQPTDNPVAAQYPDGYPLWTDAIQWDNVVDATQYGAVAGGDVETNGEANFAAFEAARDAAAEAGGGVVYFPEGTYYFRLPDPDGAGYGRGPNSRGLMLKEGVVIRGAEIPAEQRQSIIRADEDPQSQDFLQVDHNLQPLTRFVFEFQTRGTNPATQAADSAGEVPMDWSFIGIVAPEGDLATTDVDNVDNVGIVNVELEGATIFMNYHTPRSETLSSGKWLSAFKPDYPTVGAGWASRAPDGTHYMEAINGSAGWHTEVTAGSGRLVMNVKIVDGTPLNDMIFIDRNGNTATADMFSEYRFTGRISLHGSDIFVANNVVAKPTRNFGHEQMTEAGLKTVLFDYANTIGIDINKSNLGGNQDAESVTGTLGSGYYWENIIVRDNWVFNRGNKGFEVSGYHMLLLNNHNERYYNGKTLPDVSYVTNPQDAYGTESGSIDIGGVLFDGWRWQVSETSSDYMSRGYDLGGYSTYVSGNSVINTGSIGNDGEGLLGQRHNNVEVYGWSLVGNQNGRLDLGPGTSGEDGYIGPYDMHSFGLFLMGNRSTGAVGILKEEANYQVDVSNFDNVASGLRGGNDGTGLIDMYKEGSGGAAEDPVKEVHTDPVEAPSAVTALPYEDVAIEIAWTDAADNELGFRIERRGNGGVWQTVAYRPFNGEALDSVDPGTSAQSWVFTPLNELNPQVWRDFLIVPGVDYEYRVVAINANDDDSTGLSDPVAVKVEHKQVDLFAFTFNNEGKVDGKDRPIQAANWDGVYTSEALPLETSEAVFADLSEGTYDDDTPGHYKAGFLFVSGKWDQPAPEGFLVYTTNTNVVDQPQTPITGVNPQTDWYSDPPNPVSDLSELSALDLRELRFRINPRNAETVRYHFALKLGGEWYVSADPFQHSGESGWEPISLDVPSAQWYTDVVGDGSLDLDLDLSGDRLAVSTSEIGDVPVDSVGVYIDTDDNVGQQDTWARVDSYRVYAAVPVPEPPVITQQPADLSVNAGETAVFEVAVEDPEGVSYQWRKNGADLAGQTAASLTLENVMEADEGAYDVLVTGPGGSIASEAATLTVIPAPSVTPEALSVGAEAGDGMVTVDADSSISWTAESAADWITITYGSSGTGSDIVIFAVAENDTAEERVGTLTVAGATVTVTQAAGAPPGFDEIVGATTNDVGGWTSPWFGSFWIDVNGWVYHRELAWIYTGIVESAESMYLYSLTLDTWLWTNALYFNALYDFSGERYILYLVGADGRVFLFDYTTLEWSEI